MNKEIEKFIEENCPKNGTSWDITSFYFNKLEDFEKKLKFKNKLEHKYKEKGIKEKVRKI